MKKERKKRSLIWKVPLDKFKEIIKESSTVSEILLKFGLENKGGNYKTFKDRVIKEGIDISHILTIKWIKQQDG